MELETVDLGLSPEGDFLNNRSVRDLGNLHQRYKPREDTAVPVFEARTEKEGSAEDKEDGAEDAGEEEGQGQGGQDSGSQREDSQANKRRKIRFRAAPAETAATTTTDAQGNVQVYRQEGMTDAQFRTLQNRIKNRPVSSVNGTYEMHIARPIAGMKGHTAFLTFAVAPLSR